MNTSCNTQRAGAIPRCSKSPQSLQIELKPLPYVPFDAPWLREEKTK